VLEDIIPSSRATNPVLVDGGTTSVNIARGFGITFKLTGETDEEFRRVVLQQMLEGPYARRV
jgi:hypothetical protein